MRAVAAKADLRLVGIGQISGHKFASTVSSRAEELLEMMRLGAVGELTGWAFNDHGHIIDGGTNLPSHQHPTPGPGRGPDHREGCGQARQGFGHQSGAQGRLLNGPITDEATAGAILKP